MEKSKISKIICIYIVYIIERKYCLAAKMCHGAGAGAVSDLKKVHRQIYTHDEGAERLWARATWN